MFNFVRQWLRRPASSLKTPPAVVLRMALCWTITAVFAATCAAADSKSEVKTLKAATDGWPIHITYYPAKSGNESKFTGSAEAPVAILLHGAGGSRRVWDQNQGQATQSFASALQNLGYAVATVDLRKHGESVSGGGTPSDTAVRLEDYQNMWAGDLEAVKQFLMEEHHQRKLNINKLAIVASDEFAPIAAQYAVADWAKRPYDDAPATSPNERTPRGQDVRALVFLSPSGNAGSVNLMNSLKTLRDPRLGIAVLVLVGQKDTVNAPTSKHIERALKGGDREGSRTQVTFFPDVKFSGTDLLGKPSINAENTILQFLQKHLTELNSPWRDRRSRLER